MTAEMRLGKQEMREVADHKMTDETDPKRGCVPLSEKEASRGGVAEESMY